MKSDQNHRRTFRRVGIGAVIGGIVVSVVGLVGSPATASVNDTSPDAYSGNQTCSSMGYDYQYTLEPQGIPAAGDYAVPASDDVPGGATITISNIETVNGRVEFDWSSTTTWDAVMVKQANGGLIYRYDPAVTNDQNVQTVPGKNQDGISHVNFCRGGDGVQQCEAGQTGTFPDCVDPQCEPGQTGTFPDCVDAVTPCAFNAALAATDPACVAPTQVGGVVVTQTPAPVAPATQVAGTQVAAQSLPRTGSMTVPMLQLGLGLILMGAGSMIFGRERTLAI